MEISDLTVSVWQKLLPEPYEMVGKALMIYMRNNHYPPAPADLVQIMHEVELPQLSGEDAWLLIRNAYMSLYDENDFNKARQAHANLPENVRKLINPYDLIDYAFHLTSEKVRSYEKPRFIKAFESACEAETRQAIGTTSIATLAISANEVKSITGGKKNE